MSMNSFCITLDVDWAPDPVIADAVTLLDEHGIGATFFATGQSKALEEAQEKGHEVALHPSYPWGTSYDAVFKELRKQWPAAQGVRAHGLVTSTSLLGMYKDEDIAYDSDFFIPGQECLSPFFRLGGLVCLPYCWEDDAFYKVSSRFELSSLGVERRGLLVYNFHPLHIYINTPCEEAYLSAKPYYSDPCALLARRHPGKGTRTLFLAMLAYLEHSSREVLTAGEIAKAFSKKEGRA